MTEDEFWGRLEYRICDELSGMNDKDLRSMWCDGLRGYIVRPVSGPAHLGGTLYIGKTGQTAMEFTMALPDNIANFDELPWSELLPPEDVTAWLSVDPKRKQVVIDLSKAEPIQRVG